MNNIIKPRSFHLQWHITDKCNFNCKHCYRDNSISDLTKEQLFLILEQYNNLVKLWNLNGKSKISLTGGEPLLRKDFFLLLNKIKEKNIGRCYLMSNGSTVTEYVAKKLKESNIDGVQISLEGLKKNNDFIRGKGTFRKMLKGTKILIKRNIPTFFSVTITKKNINDIFGIVELAKKIGVNGVGFSRLVPLGRGEKIKKLMLSPREVKKFYNDIIDLKNKNTNLSISIHCSDSLFYNIKNFDYKIHGCSAGYDSFSILANGDVVPCRRLPIKVGNALKTPLIDIWYNSNILWKLRDRNEINNICKDCDNFNKCFGGAKCIANAYFSNPFAPDPQCWRLFHNLPRKNNFKNKKTKQVFLLKKYLDNLTSEKFISKIKNRKRTDFHFSISDLNKIDIKKLKKKIRISFSVSENELNKRTGKKIIKFFEILEKNNINFEITKPLPPCLFGHNYLKVRKKWGIPKDCSECKELYDIDKKGNIKFCKLINKTGLHSKYVYNEDQIYKIFEILKKNKNIDWPKKCNSCIYKLRGVCNIPCLFNCEKNEKVKNMFHW